MAGPWQTGRMPLTAVLLEPRPGRDPQVAGRPFSRHVEAHLRRHGLAVLRLDRQTPLAALPSFTEPFLLAEGEGFLDCNVLDLPLRLGLQDAALAARPAAAPLPEADATPDTLALVRPEALAEALAPHPDMPLHALLQAVATRGSLRRLAYERPSYSTATPAEAERALEDLPGLLRRPAVFFDRDGVLNADHGYVHRPQDFHWTPGAIQAVKLVNDTGRLAIVITNQSGIARGYYGPEDFTRLMDWAARDLVAHGAHLDAVYHCPHHPTKGQGPWRTACDCRKPGPGLIDQALADWDIDLAASLVVGDKPRDLEAGAARGVPGALFEGGDLRAFLAAII